MKVVVGLGNPGKKYESTRHNIGFIVLDEFVSFENLWIFSFVSKFNAEILEVIWWWEKVLFVKPMTFMNKSGDSIKALANFYKFDAKNILVIHDEIDLPVWSVKLKTWGGHAGHNGLKDLILKIGSEFFRIRFGVDRPSLREQVVDYVLWDFSKDEFSKIKDLFPDVFEKIKDFLKN